MGKTDRMDCMVLERKICLYDPHSKPLYPLLWMRYMCLSSVDLENIRISI